MIPRALRPYQQDAILEVSQKFASGVKNLIFQLATGGGKTVVMSAIVERYKEKSNKQVLILVHRDELLKQTHRTLYNWYGIVGEFIDDKTKQFKIGKPAYIGMCESVNNRLKKDEYKPLFNVGMVIVDECHRGEFFKLIPLFEKSLVLGFTATPISSQKKKPLKGFFQDIVCGIDIPALIEMNKLDPTQGLVQNFTYRPVGQLERKGLKTDAKGEINTKQQSGIMRGQKHIAATLAAYEKYLKGKKTLIFNVDIQHSEDVNAAFVAAGYNSRALDSKRCENDPEYRTEFLKWFKENPDAIAQNIDILTTGFDEPSVMGVIVNLGTNILSKWIQMVGRGARPYPNKDHFICLDMGNNVGVHMDWSDPRDWKEIFFNPDKAKNGAPPMKECPVCHLMVPISTRTCWDCGYNFPLKDMPGYNDLPLQFELVTKSLSVERLIEYAERNSKSPYWPFFQLGNDIARVTIESIPEMREELYIKILAEYHEKLKGFCIHKGLTKLNRWMKNKSDVHLRECLEKHYGEWIPKQPHPQKASEKLYKEVISAIGDQLDAENESVNFVSKF